jgi:hypothetical protein
MLRLILGQCDDIDPATALHAAIAQCREALKGIQPQAALLFSPTTPLDYHGYLKIFTGQFPEVPFIGCTTAGAFSSRMGSTDNSVVLSMICSDNHTFQVGAAEGLSENAHTALTKALKRDPQSSTATFHLSLMDGIKAFGADINKALAKIGLYSASFFGGTSGDSLRFLNSFQFEGPRVFNDAITTLSIQGPLLYGTGVAHGWEPIGRQGIITRAEGNVVYEINHKPAFSFFHYYTDADTREILQFPLAVYHSSPSEGCSEYDLRYGFRWSEEKGWMAFSGCMPMGALVRLTIPGRRQLLSAAGSAIEAALADYPGKNPAMAFCLSNAVRPQILGTMKNEEFSSLINRQGRPIPFFGFNSFGEIAPISRNSRSIYHCNCFAALILGED